jgi:hypothetical protein
MKAKAKEDIESGAFLSDIANHLIINGSLVYFSGLSFGKMGIAVFFYHYGRYTDNPLFGDYAHALVKQAKSQIHEDYPLEYERGLAGVGSALEYLSQNGFLQSNQEALSGYDKKIGYALSYEKNPVLLSGFGRYLLYRLKSHGDEKIREYSVLLTRILIDGSMEIQLQELPDVISILCRLSINGICRQEIGKNIARMCSEIGSNVRGQEWVIPFLKVAQLQGDESWRHTVQCQLDHVLKQNDQTDTVRHLQWLLQCFHQISNRPAYAEYVPLVRQKITASCLRYTATPIETMFAENQNFSLQGGYAGLGLSFMAAIDCNHTSWLSLL